MPLDLTLPPATDPRDRAILEEVARLIDRDQGRAAIARLMAALREQPSAALERCHVDLRVAVAAAEAPTARGPAEWPGPVADPFPGQVGLPTISADQVSRDMIAGAILHHGSIRIRGLIDAAEASAFAQGIDQTFEARDRSVGGAPVSETAPWYDPLPGGGPNRNITRRWVEAGGGGAWTADSPRMLFRLYDLFDRLGLPSLIEEHFGERPVLTLNKTTLRRVPLDAGGQWHQDGRFLGRDIRALNVWIALSECGIDAPGLDLVPTRVPTILPSGTHGALFDWSVGQDLVVESGLPMISPHFLAGDVVMFDHMMLHQTAIRPTMTRPRWALESWFFAPSSYPHAEHVALAV